MSITRVPSFELLKQAHTQANSIKKIKQDMAEIKRKDQQAQHGLSLLSQNPQLAKTMEPVLGTLQQPAGNSEGTDFFQKLLTDHATLRNEAIPALSQGKQRPDTKLSSSLSNLSGQFQTSSPEQVAEMINQSKGTGKKLLAVKNTELKRTMDTTKESLFPQLRKMSPKSQEKIPDELKPAFQTWKQLNPSSGK